MKKRVLSLFLAVVMILTMLPTTALAAASFPPKDGRYWENLTEDEAVELLENTNRSGSYVFVYYSDTCGNSQREVPRMADYAADQGILVYGYNCKGRDNRVSTVIARQTGWSQIGWPVAIAANFDEDPILSYAVKSATLNGFITALEHCLLVDDDPDDDFTSSDSVTLLYDDSVSAKEWDVLRLTNRHRMELGLKPLTTTDKMQMAANQRAYELTEAYNADHTRPDGSKCYTALDDYGVSGYTVAAENIAYNFTSAASVVDAWLNSDGHRANIERGDLTHLGVGEDSRYWSQDFIGGSCSYSNLSLSPSRVNAKLGQDLEELLEDEDVTLTAACSKHGASSLPVIAGMCSGYRANTPGAQSVTVSLGGRTATLTVNVDGSCAKHTFDKGVVTTAPTCVTEGLRTYTCTACGAVETEIIPMLPHSPDANGKCTVCGRQVADGEYTVTVEHLNSYADYAGVILETDGDDYIPGAKVTVTLEAGTVGNAPSLRAGKIIVKDSSGKVLAQSNGKYRLTFTMPASDVTVGVSLEPGDVKLTTKVGSDYPEGGTIQTSYSGKLQAGKVVKVKAIAYEGYRLESVRVRTSDGTMDETVRDREEFRFTMPSVDTTITAAFVPDEIYKVKVKTEGPYADCGKVKAEYPEELVVGSTVRVSLYKIKEGYQAGIITVRDAKGKQLYQTFGKEQFSFKMPASDVTVSVTFEPKSDLPFLDVGRHWALQAILYAYQHGLFSGISDFLFGPDDLMNRAMVVTVLARISGYDPTGGSTWYSGGRDWAMRHGVSDGSNMMGSITREQLATMLYRMAGSPKPTGSLKSFPDASSVSSYAVDAMRWAVSEGLISGMDGRLNPKGNATRAQVATMMMRFNEL